MTSTRSILPRAALAAVLVMAASLAATPTSAQSSSQQAGRPQPPPAPKTAPPPDAKPVTAPPQAPGSKAAGAGTAKPASGSPQPPAGAKAPPPKKPAPPQTSKVWKGRGFVVANVGAQLTGPGYTSAATFKVHAEDATLEANAATGVGPAVGVRGGVRVWKNLAIGAGLEWVSTSQSLSITGRLPHPFQFNQFREVEGTADGLDRVETLVGFEVSWLAPLTRRIDMLVFAGPAYIGVRQEMATRIQFTESYPYDTATFIGIETASVSGGGVGLTAGVDVSYLLTKRLGVGGEVRYSYASTTLTPSDKPAAVGLGGLQATFGARILF